MSDEPFRLVGERLRHRGRILSVATTTWLDTASGQEFERDLVRHPGAVAVVPLIGDGPDREVVLVRQFRTSLGRSLLEIPAGICDVDGESPEETARRELLEEAGYETGHLELLIELDTAPGFCDEVIPIYLATGPDNGLLPLRLESCPSTPTQHRTMPILPPSLTCNRSLACPLRTPRCCSPR